MAALERHFVHFGASDSLPEVAVHRAVMTSTTVVRDHDLDGANTNTSTRRSVELDGWRYFTAMPCPSTEQPAQLCLFFKDKALDEAWVGAVTSEDGLHFTDAPALVMPQRTTFGRRNRQVRLLTHNLALTFHRGQYYAIGGQDNKKLGRVNRGLWLAQGAAWHYAAGNRSSVRDLATDADGGVSQWRNVRNVINGSHPGCLEARDWLPYLRDHQGGGSSRACEFDGRLSLLHFRKRFWLFARQNPATHSQRFVQVTSSADGTTWAPFQAIALADYAHTEGNIYFFAAQVNPVLESSLLALFPLEHRGQGCLAFACSRDGVRWSRPMALLSCEVDVLDRGDRTIHHPVAGLVRRGDVVWLYVHENVPGVVEKSRAMPKGARPQSVPRSRIVRYDMPAERLLEWTQRGLAAL